MVMTRWEVSNNCILPSAGIKLNLCPMLESRITNLDPAKGGGLTHFCHSRIISSHNTCFEVILCLQHNIWVLFLFILFFNQTHCRDFAGCFGICERNRSVCARSYLVPIIPLILFGRDLFTFVRQQKQWMRCCYHLWTEGLRSDSCCRWTENERERETEEQKEKKMCERKRMRYFQGEAGWHQIHSSEL